jgi:hypothetical protein
MNRDFDYPALLRLATIGVVRDVLVATAADGLVGDHHFYLTFRTGADGVAIPPALRARYQETMTIVLQHQFVELTVDEEAFAVTLRFGGAWERVRVPFEALTSFLDPSVPFGLDFTQFAHALPGGGAPTAAGEAPTSGPVAVREEAPAVPDAGSAAPGAGERPGDLLPFRRR